MLSPQQNKALNLWCRQYAEALNETGQFDVTAYLEVTSFKVNTPWDEHIFKTIMVKRLAKELYDKDSTIDLTTTELTRIAEALEKNISEHTGAHIPFPSEEE